jgi:hypothetical protein
MLKTTIRARLTCLAAFCLAGLASSAIATTDPNQTALRCGVNQDDRPQHFFADPDGNGKWKEYESLAKVQVNDNGGMSALVWVGANGKILVGTDEPGEDFGIYTDYCFDPKGRLIQLRLEVRTAWGWAYQEEGPVSRGTLKPATSKFIGTETGARIDRPAGAEDIPRALRPKLYRRKSELPFFKLLSK